MSDKVALITGTTGQDGAYLAELLLAKGYVVHGVKRRSSSLNTQRVDHLYVDPHVKDARFFLHYGDMTDATNLIRLIQESQPTEIYNLAAQSHVQVSFETPEYTANADALGTLRLLEAIRILKLETRVRFYQASTSELYGNTSSGLLNEIDTVCAAQPVRCRQALCLLDYGELSRGLRHARLERNLVQPRKPDPWRNLCHAQDHPRRRSVRRLMMYQLYQAQADLLFPLRQFARIGAGVARLADCGRACHRRCGISSAGLTMFADAGLTHHRPPFGIDVVSVDNRASR